MKKLWAWLTKHKDTTGLLLHAAWIGVNIVYKDFSNQEEYIAGHGVIGGLTGVGVWDRAKRNSKAINNNITKAANVFRSKENEKEIEP